MAKVEGPLGSHSAHGSVGNILTFSKKKSGQQVRYQKKQSDVTSASRADVRAIYRLAVACWKNKTQEQKDVFNDLVKQKNLSLTGWNYFVKLACSDPLTYLGLLAYWSLNVQNGASVKDLSKNGNTGTLKPTYPGNCPVYAASGNNKLFECLEFDGIDDYVEFDPGLLGNDIECTISIWFKPTVASGMYIFGNNDQDASGTGMGIKLDTDRGWAIFSHNSSGVRVIVNDVKKYRLFEWNHLVVVKTSDVISVYFNGVYDNQMESVGYKEGVRKYVIGVYPKVPSIFFLKGYIDDVSLWNRALSGDEIKSLYNSFK
jgi:hypothetical protein